MVKWDYNVRLLLLQIVLERQETLVQEDKSLQLSELLVDPVIDVEVWTKLITHPVLLYFAPELQEIQVEDLQDEVKALFEEGFPPDCEEFEDEDVTVVSLANFYYAKRISELENDKLPVLKREILRNAGELTGGTE